MGITARDVYLQKPAPVPRQRLVPPAPRWPASAPRQVVLRRIDGEEILRRIEAEGVTPVLCGSPPVVAAALACAPRCRRAAAEEVPGRGTVRMMVGGRAAVPRA